MQKDKRIQELTDLLYTIRNATLIGDHLIKHLDKEPCNIHLLPTILEYIFENAQKILDEYCEDKCHSG